MEGFKDSLNKAVSKIQEGAKGLLDKTDIDEKVVATAKDLKGKAQELLDKTDVDEKVVAAAKDLKGKAQELLDKTDVDEKVVAAAKDLKDKAQAAIGLAKPGVEDAFNKAAASAKSLFDQSVEMIQTPKPKDAMEQIQDEVADQVDEIRAASTTATDPIHDYFQKKFHPAEGPEEPAEDDVME